MRLTTINLGSVTRAARLDDEQLLPLRAPDVGALLALPDRQAALEDVDGPPVTLAQADFALLVPHPAKVLCVGLNYASHILETGNELPKYPTIFNKFADTLLGAHDDLVLPSISNKVDWEVELGVVIGAPLQRGSVKEAEAAIAGYAVFNDISMRDWQLRTTQLLQGKVFPRTTPVGDFLVTPDEVDHGSDLWLRTEVNGVVMQEGRTSDLVFGPVEVAAYVSQFTPLGPGDLLLTGTPAGIGFSRNPPIFLSPGDVVRVEVEGLGECRNRCLAEG
jgi:acylpyruvate hydrolase